MNIHLSSLALFSISTAFSHIAIRFAKKKKNMPIPPSPFFLYCIISGGMDLFLMVTKLESEREGGRECVATADDDDDIHRKRERAFSVIALIINNDSSNPPELCDGSVDYFHVVIVAG